MFFRCVVWVLFVSILEPKGCQPGSRKTSKIVKNRLRDFPVKYFTKNLYFIWNMDAPGRPRGMQNDGFPKRKPMFLSLGASRNYRSPGSSPGSVLEPFWRHFESESQKREVPKKT